MSIRNIATNVGSLINHGADSLITNAGSAITALVGSTQKALQSAWTGGFVGVNVDNYEEIKTVIQKFIDDIEGALSQFNTSVDWTTGLKGEAAAAANEYVKAVNELLLAYATTYKEFLKVADDAMMAWAEGDRDNAAAIRDAAQELKAKAAEIRID